MAMVKGFQLGIFGNPGVAKNPWGIAVGGPPKNCGDCGKIAGKIAVFLRQIAVGKNFGSLTADREKGAKNLQVQTKPKPSKNFHIFVVNFH